MDRPLEDISPSPDASVEELFLRVIELAPAEQAAAAQRWCTGRPVEQRELERLLAAHQIAASQMPTPAPGGSPMALADGAPDPLVGHAVGAFHVLRLIGSGGMGWVYEAEQDYPKRRVALKLMRPLAGPSAVQRFRHEAQTLGTLEHPGIARLYHAGVAVTPLGRLPYFAMEMVEGEPLSTFVASHRLTLRGKLELFCAVCDAVEYAHRRGVIHRDLKPGNILVNAAGQPKVLDFGIARVIGAELPAATMNTIQGQLMGTLAYMSPEQAAGDTRAVDTRSDVYSLGMILYEIIAGAPPYVVVGRSLTDAVAIVRECVPARLGEKDTVLRGDIETIAGRSLEKLPDARYQSAAELAADIRRHIADEPILARAPTSIEQCRRFARKNRALVAGVCAVLLALVAGLVTTMWQAARATTALRLAETTSARNRLNEYIADIQAAAAALRSDDVTTAIARLDAAPPEHRAWEWRYLRAQVDRSDRHFEPLPADWKPSFVSGLSVSPDGAKVAATFSNDRVVLFDRASGRILKASEPDVSKNYGHVEWSPDGRQLLATRPYAMRVDVFDAESLATLRSMTVEGEAVCATWSPDGKVLALGSGHWAGNEEVDCRVMLVDSATGNKVGMLEGAPGRPEVVAFSPDGEHLLCLARNGLVRWDVVTGERTDADITITVVQSAIGAAISPDGTLVAVGDRAGVVLLDGITLRRKALLLSGQDSLRCLVTFTPDSRRVVAASNASVVAWDVDSGRVVMKQHGMRGSAFRIAAGRSGEEIFSGDGMGTVRAWRLDAPSDVLSFLARDNAAPAPDFSAAAHTLRDATEGTGSQVVLRDLDNGTKIGGFELGEPDKPHNGDLLYSPNGRYIARWQAGSGLWLRDLASGQAWHAKDSAPSLSHLLRFSASGDRIALLRDGRAGVWTVPGLSPVSEFQEPDAAALDLSADGKTAFLGFTTGKIAVRDIASGTTLVSWQAPELGTVIASLHLFASDRMLASVVESTTSETSRIILWDAKSGEWRGSSSLFPSHIADLAFDAAGTRCFASGRDGAVRVICISRTGEGDSLALTEVISLPALSTWVTRVFLSADGDRLFAATVWPHNWCFVWDARQREGRGAAVR